MSKVYCTECRYLELRPCFAEDRFFSGKYVFTGTRFRCNKYNKILGYELGSEYIEFNFCLFGERGEENGYLNSVNGMLEETRKKQCEWCPDTTKCANCEGTKLINKLVDRANGLKAMYGKGENDE